MTWSFSRINYTCLADFYQTYVLKKKGEDNGWSELGLFCHDLVERVAKGELSKEEARVIFKRDFFSNIKHLFPATPYWQNPEDDYYAKIKPWFEREHWWEGEVVSVEEHLEFTLPSGEKFQGYIDRVSRVDGDIELVDYKVAKKYKGVGLLEKSRQLMLYAYGYHQKHGIYPSRVMFEYFQFTKTNGEFNYTHPSVIEFDEKQMLRAVKWAEDRIVTIKRLLEQSKTEKGHFMPDYDELSDKSGIRGYYCKNICSHREDCPFTDGAYFKKF